MFRSTRLVTTVSLTAAIAVTGASVAYAQAKTQALSRAAAIAQSMASEKISDSYVVYGDYFVTRDLELSSAGVLSGQVTVNQRSTGDSLVATVVKEGSKLSWTIYDSQGQSSGTSPFDDVDQSFQPDGSVVYICVGWVALLCIAAAAALAAEGCMAHDQGCNPKPKSEAPGGAGGGGGGDTDTTTG